MDLKLSKRANVHPKVTESVKTARQNATTLAQVAADILSDLCETDKLRAHVEEFQRNLGQDAPPVLQGMLIKASASDSFRAGKYDELKGLLSLDSPVFSGAFTAAALERFNVRILEDLFATALAPKVVSRSAVLT